MASGNLIQKITRLAVQNFCRDTSRSHNVGVRLSVGASIFEQIKDLINRITVADLHINTSLLHEQEPFNPQLHTAPITYIQIYEDVDVTICVFILKSGARVPLHDHPGMTGLLKVIHGKVYVESYTLLDKLCLGSEKSLFKGKKQSFTDTYSALKHPGEKVTQYDPVCCVTQSSKNLHEISSVDGLAAFIDILAPPYGTDSRTGFERDCHYYKEIDKNKLVNKATVPDDSVVLVRIPAPSDFWCDRAEYEGSPVSP